MTDKTLEHLKLLGKCNTRVLRQIVGTALPWEGWVAINSETYEVVSKRHWEHNLFGYITPQGWVEIPTKTIQDYLDAIPVRGVFSEGLIS